MRRISLIARLALFALVLFISHAQARETWTNIRTKNFNLIGNGSGGDIRKVAVRLEEFRQAMALIFPRTRIESPVPTTVIIFKTDSSFKPFKPKYNGRTQDLVGGYFLASQDVNYMALTTDIEGASPFEIIFHEYHHFILNNNLRDAPLWLNEGLAEFYSTFSTSDDGQQIHLGEPIGRHIFYLRDRPLLPLKTLLTVDEHSPYYNESGKVGVFYAESWVLVHYLMLGNNGARQQQLVRFIGNLNSGIPLEENFRQSFQADYKTIEEELSQYVRKFTFPVLTAKLKNPFDYSRESQSAVLSEAEVQYYLGDLLMHSRRYEEAEERLQKSISLDPHLAPALVSLGQLRGRQGRVLDARKFFEDAMAADPNNYMAHFYYALTLNQEGRHEDAVKALTRAAALKPNSARVQTELGLTYLELGRNEESVAAFNKASQLDPFDYQSLRTRAYAFLRHALGGQAALAASVYIGRRGWHDDHSAYMALAEHFGYRQAGRADAASKVLDEAASKLDTSAWPYPVIRYLRRELSAEALMALATDNDKLTEAHAYLGLDFSLSGNPKRAIEHLRWVVENGNRNFVEYPLAAAELRRLMTPTQAATP